MMVHIILHEAGLAIISDVANFTLQLILPVLQPTAPVRWIKR